MTSMFSLKPIHRKERGKKSCMHGPSLTLHGACHLPLSLIWLYRVKKWLCTVRRMGHPAIGVSCGKILGFGHWFPDSAADCCTWMLKTSWSERIKAKGQLNHFVSIMIVWADLSSLTKAAIWCSQNSFYPEHCFTWRCSKATSLADQFDVHCLWPQIPNCISVPLFH